MKSLILGLVFGSLLMSEPLSLRVSMVSLGVTDMERSVAFYRDTLRLTMSGNPGEVTLFRAGEITIVLNKPLASAAKGALTGAIEIIFPVDSVISAHAELLKRGCNFIQAPREVTTGMWAATFTDPDGHRLTLFGPR